jgi:hypothetical protein
MATYYYMHFSYMPCSVGAGLRNPLLGANGIMFKKGDTINVSGQTGLNSTKTKNWSKSINGFYRITHIAGPMLALTGPATSNWGTGSLNGPMYNITVSSSGGAIISGAVNYDCDPEISLGGSMASWNMGLESNQISPSDMAARYASLATAAKYASLATTPVTGGPYPVLNPTVPTTPTPPIAPSTTTVKINGTTVTVPFLTSASFKPGTSVLANNKGKAAFIKAVQAASKASNLNKAQSDQLMADVVKAIKDADLKRRKITPLKGKK